MAEELNIKRGGIVEVLSVGNEAMFTGRVERYMFGTLSLKDAKGKGLPVGTVGKLVKLRFDQGNNNLMAVAKIAKTSKELWKLDSLERRFVAPKREFFRQRIKVQAAVICIQRSKASPEVERGKTWVPCSIIDVSAGGLQLVSKERFQVDDLIMIREARLVAKSPPFSFTCRIRRSLHLGGEDDPTTQCGCQLINLSQTEQDRLQEAIFAIQREEIQRRRGLR